MAAATDEKGSLKEFWEDLAVLVDLPLDYGETEEVSINKKLVGYITLTCNFTEGHEFESQQQEFEFYYKLTKQLVVKSEFELNITFCIRKLLSLLDYILTNDSPYVTYYSVHLGDEMDESSVRYLNANSNMVKVVSFVLLIHYKLSRDIVYVLQQFQGLGVMSRVLVDNYNRNKCSQLQAHESVYRNFMELLYEFCKEVKLSSEELGDVDQNFIHYLLDSIRGLTKVEDEYNFYKFKVVIILNEQYMVNFYEEHDSERGPSENKIFVTLLKNEDFFRNFIDCLILNFNRESGDHVIQILILKILYLIFTTSMTCQKFYLNDLKVLIDIFVRELNNLSIYDNQIPLINTYLRVLYPMLLFSQMKSEKYKFRSLAEISRSLLRDLDDEDSYSGKLSDESLEEVQTSRRLVLRLMKFLNHDILRTDSVSSEISNHSATNINKISSKSQAPAPVSTTVDPPEASKLSSRSSSVVSQMSALSINSKKVPPPVPLPRKAQLYKNDSSSETSFASYSPTASKR